MLTRKTIYAVVDLEATGTSAADGDRIIQFSCTFVQNRRIIDTFSTLINPEQPIPERITQLTGITNEMVASAPTFADVATLLKHLLQTTVFVAHNVNFDFPFFNSELKRLGRKPLDIKAIDTVTLSQILLPQLPSYQLRQISRYFNIIHKHPHSASSDSIATAYLLILLMSRLDHLPTPTLKKILQIHPPLPRNTFELFQTASRRRKRHPQELKSGYKLVNGIVLRKTQQDNSSKSNAGSFKFPYAKAQKMTLWGRKLAWRPQQAKMMNSIYRNYAQTGKSARVVMTETGAGVGRKLGYTLPFAYLSHQQHQTVVISCASYLNQLRLEKQTLPVLNTILPFKIKSMVVRSCNNYLNLHRFAETLAMDDHSDLTALIKAKVLVWLTETKTGDLNELHLDQSVPYLHQICHLREQVSKRHNPYYRDDPLRKAQQRARQVDFVIVDHGFLIQNASYLAQLSSKPYLVLDEVASLPATVQRNSRLVLRFNSLDLIARKLLGDLHRSHGDNLFDVVGNHQRLQAALKVIAEQTQLLFDVGNMIDQAFAHKFLGRDQLTLQGRFYYRQLTNQKVSAFFKLQNSQLQKLNHGRHLINYQVNVLQSALNQQTESKLSALVFDNFSRHIQNLNQVLDRLNALIHEVNQENKSMEMQLKVPEPHAVSQCTLTANFATTAQNLQKLIYQYFAPTFCTGHAIFTDHYPYLRKQLGLPEHVLEKDFAVPMKFNFEIAQSSQEFTDPELAVPWLVQSLKDLMTQNPGRVLVSFSSNTLRLRVFKALVSDPNWDVRCFAPRLSESPQRVVKKLLNVPQALILGENPWVDEMCTTKAPLFQQIVLAELPLGWSNPKQSKTEKILTSVLWLKLISNHLKHFNDHLLVLDGRLLKGQLLKRFQASTKAQIMVIPRRFNL